RRRAERVAHARPLKEQTMADDITHYDAVEGYFGRLSYTHGEQAALHVRSTTSRFDVDIFRDGGHGTLVWSAHDLDGIAHDTPPDADAHGCGWPVSVRIPIGHEWRSGVYIAHLRAHDVALDRASSSAMFVVRPSTRTADVLLVLATNTYNAYNSWGGRSL